MYKKSVLTIGDWIIAMIILSIPIVNIIMLIVWAVGKEYNQTFQNYIRSMIIYSLVLLVIGFIFYGQIIDLM